MNKSTRTALIRRIHQARVKAGVGAKVLSFLGASGSQLRRATRSFLTPRTHSNLNRDRVRRRTRALLREAARMDRQAGY